MKLKCPRCGYVWEYKGKSKEALCPICLHIVKVRGRWVEEGGRGTRGRWVESE